MTRADHFINGNPFPGLRPFDVDDGERFFGREQQIQELVALLHGVSFVAVAGSSGCGKSSLVRAGLLRALSKQRDAGGIVWHCAVLRPGHGPIANLAEQLARLLNGSSGADEGRRGALYGRLRLGSLGLAEAINLARLGEGARALIVVDQFEELFRFQPMTDPEEASAFVKLLLNAARDPRSPVSVVITLRSDALGSCADFRDLPEAVSRGQYLVPRLARDQRKDAIVKPIELRGASIAPRLVQRILNDVSDSFDDLPVMQHVLARTWHRWAQVSEGQRPIDLEDYEAEEVGTAKQALSRHADEAFHSLPGLESVVERVFKAITERISTGVERRRPLRFKRLCEIVGGDADLVRQVIERYRRPDTAFLMPPPEVSLADNPVVDISHESLIRQWQRLHAWTQEEAESTAMLLRVVDAARQHAGGGGSLWRGPNLKSGLEWRRRVKPTAAWVGLYAGGDGTDAWKSAETFLDASSKDAVAERRRWQLLVGLASALALAVVAGVILAAVDAYSRQRRIMSRELANRALLEVEREPAHGAWLAHAATDQDPSNASADYALRQALVDLEIAHTETILTLGRPVSDARYTQDGERLVVASGNTVSVFDARSPGQVLQSFTREGDVQNAWLLGRHTLLFTQTRDHAQVQRVGDPVVHELTCPGEANTVYALSVSPDERWAGIGCFDGELMVWDTADITRPPQRFGRAEGNTLTALAFSSDGQFVAGGNTSGAVEVWKIGERGPWLGGGPKSTSNSPIAHQSGRSVRDIAFHPTDADLLVTTADDNQAIVWQLDLARRRPVNARAPLERWVLSHDRPVTRARFAPRADASDPLFTVSDKAVRFWVNATLDLSQVRAHDDWVTDANASADGELLVTASSDGTARLWSARSGSPVAALRGHSSLVTRAAISPDGSRVLTASLDGTVRVWRINPPRLLWSAKGWMLSAAFEPGGHRIAVGEEGESAILDPGPLDSPTPPARRDLAQTNREDQVHGFSWSHDRELLTGVRGSYRLGRIERPIALWDVQSGREITPDWLERFTHAVFAPASDELLTLDEKGRVVVWPLAEVANPKQPAPAVPPFGEGYWMAVMSPDAEWIAAVATNDIALWKRSSLASGPRLLTGHSGSIRSVQFSADSQRLVSAGEDRTARVWQVSADVPPVALTGGHSAALSWATFNPAGTLIATTSADGTIRVWDAATLRTLAVLRWHGDAVNHVQFSADGQWLLTASDDGTVKLGQCRPCGLTQDELRARVHELGRMPDEQMQQVQREIAQATATFRLLTLFSRR